MKTEISAESGKSALALIGAAAASLTLNQWVAMATGVYVVIQVAYLVRKWYREEKDWARGT
jgi:4-hydroxybenzoate polyprenyltransferase